MLVCFIYIKTGVYTKSEIVIKLFLTTPPMPVFHIFQVYYKRGENFIATVDNESELVQYLIEYLEDSPRNEDSEYENNEYMNRVKSMFLADLITEAIEAETEMITTMELLRSFGEEDLIICILAILSRKLSQFTTTNDVKVYKLIIIPRNIRNS